MDIPFQWGITRNKGSRSEISPSPSPPLLYLVFLSKQRSGISDFDYMDTVSYRIGVDG